MDEDEAGAEESAKFLVELASGDSLALRERLRGFPADLLQVLVGADTEAWPLGQGWFAVGRLQLRRRLVQEAD